MPVVGFLLLNKIVITGNVQTFQDILAIGNPNETKNALKLSEVGLATPVCSSPNIFQTADAIA